jgi:Methyladenine glycosylase
VRKKVRCEWAANGDPVDIDYHDNEWGVPVHSDRKLFEFLLLEYAQAGLSWSLREERLTILMQTKSPIMIKEASNNYLAIQQSYEID